VRNQLRQGGPEEVARVVDEVRKLEKLMRRLKRY
jgi:hypothetical protein